MLSRKKIWIPKMVRKEGKANEAQKGRKTIKSEYKPQKGDAQKYGDIFFQT